MITGALKSKVDRIWDAFWSGGIANPLEVIEQITYLLFIRRLDDLQTLAEAKANRTGKPIENPVFQPGEYELRWSRFKELEPGVMFQVIDGEVFPFLRQLGGDGSTYSQHMKDARFTIPTPALLAVQASWIIVITTGTCMVLEPPAGRLVDKIGPGIPITIALLTQAGALFWMGTFDASTTLGEMIIPLALMGAGVGIALPSCNTAGMSAVDPKRAGMGSGLMQMTFNIPAALGVALVTSIIGTLSLSRVESAVSGTPYVDQATQYAQAMQGGDANGAADILKGVPSDVASTIEAAVESAQASSIAISMVALGIVALAGAIFALLVIGRRREPDHLPADDLTMA